MEGGKTESLLESILLCRPSATLPEERGPAAIVPGRKAETDRVREGISESFHPAQFGQVASKGREPIGGRKWLLRFQVESLRRMGTKYGVEAPSGVEPLHRSFADCSLNHLGTAPWGHYSLGNR